MIEISQSAACLATAKYDHVCQRRQTQLANKPTSFRSSVQCTYANIVM